ncbi:MAG: ABC transporter permease [Candidatus Omnitrophica bacterium]|nr:ABC transporter permease [Candidatus Omnitrophota bacterium]
MTNSIYDIPVPFLAVAMIPLVIVMIIYIRWALPYKTLLDATARMLIQLILIGFVLIYIFESHSPWLVTGILSFMLMIASWIAIRPLTLKSPDLYLKTLASLSIGCLSTLILVIGGVIRLSPWHEPRYLIPIAGMIFANAMNGLSLAIERFHSETERNIPYIQARNKAYQACLIPLLNSFFAVGLVSLPGMMTGQILAGVSPLIAVRYQIVVMAMLLGATGISAAIYLAWQRPNRGKDPIIN